MSNVCLICSKKTNFINGKVVLKNDSLICGNCAVKANLIKSGMVNKELSASLSISEVKNRIDSNEIRNNSFQPSLKIDNTIWFDDINKLVKISPKSNKNVICYDEIIDFKVIEDNNVVTKSGAASAIGGGLIFGPAGAIVGGLFSRGKKKKEIVEKLQIIIIEKDHSTSTINFLSTKTKRSSFVFKVSYESFLKVGSKLEDIINNDNKNIEKNELKSNNFKQDLIDLKELLDLEIITQEEFDKKKLEILRK